MQATRERLSYQQTRALVDAHREAFSAAQVVKKSFLQARDFMVTHRAVFMALFVVALFASVGFAQTTTPTTVDVNLDLSEFWAGFNTFFNALFPPMAFIASIGAAIGFIFMVINALVGVFRTRMGGR